MWLVRVGFVFSYGSSAASFVTRGYRESIMELRFAPFLDIWTTFSAVLIGSLLDSSALVGASSAAFPLSSVSDLEV